MPDLLNTEGFVIFTTREFANRAGISMSAAAKRLSRLSDKESLLRITKGVWGNTSHPYFHPLSCVPYLLGKEQGFVSDGTASARRDFTNPKIDPGCDNRSWSLA